MTGRAFVNIVRDDLIDMTATPTDAEQMVFEALLEDREAPENVREAVWGAARQEVRTDEWVLRWSTEEDVTRLMWSARHSIGRKRELLQSVDLEALLRGWGRG